MSTFDSTKRLLPDILAHIVKGKIQLSSRQQIEDRPTLPQSGRGWSRQKSPTGHGLGFHMLVVERETELESTFNAK
jgi:hypothetical protein